MLESFPPLAFNAFWIAQVLVACAAACEIASWQFKGRQYILAFLCFSTFLIGTHFILLGEYVAAMIEYVASVRFLVALFSTDKRLMSVFMILLIILFVLFYQGFIDVLVLVVGLLFTYASFQKEDKSIRQITMLGLVLFITYSVIMFAPGAALLGIVVLTSNIIGYWRFYIRQKLSY